MPPPDTTPWDRLAAARRAAPPAGTPPPPEGFAARLAGRLGEIWANERVRLWSRWCLIAAAAAGLAAALSGILTPEPAPPGPPLLAPSISIPAP